MRRLRVGVLFGGRSGEHEVSLASAQSLLSALDPDRYEAVPIGVTREGEWRIGAPPDRFLPSEVTTGLPGTLEALPDPSHHGIVRLNGSPSELHESAIDVVFPVLHGPNGEDGTVQGLLTMAGIPFVGSDVLGSALGMDKWRMKAVFAQWGLPNVPYRGFRRATWEHDRKRTLDMLEQALRYPMFVKPSNMGSSVGISRALDRDGLAAGIDTAARFDATIVVEEGIDAREVECGVLGNDEPVVSVVGEVRSHHEFYDYDAKYTAGLADLIIPAKISEAQTAAVRAMAAEAFLAVGAAGLARVDFFIRAGDGEVLINEINTMPGFTATSMYPRLWEASGVPYRELVDRLIGLALERFDDNQRHQVRR